MKKILLTGATLLATSALWAQQIDTSLIKKDIEMLASESFEGRRTATKGDTLSREYLIERLSAISGVELLGDGGLDYCYGMTSEVTSTYDRAKRSSYRKNKVVVKSLNDLPQNVHGKMVEIDSVLVHKNSYQQIRTAIESLKSDSAAIVRFPLPITNVVAKISAPHKRNKDNRAVIIGAHYDHEGFRLYKGKPALHPGADDNASGVAFALELARMIASQQEKMERDVIFVLFGAEERGLLGSNGYAIDPIEPLENVDLMINFDMLGRMRGKGITVRGLGTSKEIVPVMNSLDNSDNLEIIWEFRGNGPTDYAPFYRKGKVPAISFSTRLHEDYHKPGDTIDKINYEGIEMAGNYIWQIVEKSVFEDTKFTFVEMY